MRESERRLRTLLDFVPYPIAVFTLEGRVYYLNPSFTKTFGWTLQELEGKTIPYVPPGMEQETGEIIKKLLKRKVLFRHETKRLTKDGRVLDVIMRAAIYSEAEDEPAGELVLLRDITQEKRNARNHEAMLRISMALPQYPDLEELLDYISDEIKALLSSEGALVILLDEEKEELFFLGVAYDDEATEKRVKEIRFPLDQLVAGNVIKTGEPIIVSDTSKDPHLHQERDKKLGYHTKNLLLVPLRSSDRIIGVISAINKKEGMFDQTDVELLSMIAGTVALSIENARFSEELKTAYREVTSLNRAKDKVINHLSHELKTPVSVLSGSFNILERRLATIPEETWKPTVERAKRNLDRIMDIQYEVDDIIQGKHHKEYNLLSLLLDQCADELETLVAQEVGEGSIIETLRRRVEEIFGLKKIISKKISLEEYTRKRLEVLKPLFSHRQVEIISRLEPRPYIYIPHDTLNKVIDGLVKNAIENTPDEGKVEVVVRKSGESTELIVHDYGVGIKQDDQRRIFEGFFPTQDTMKYSSKRPFDFNAGGKGGDLLRMKIFSGRYNFKIHMNSSRCLYISREGYVCPGRISKCKYCRVKEDCYHSGETIFTLYFPPAPH
ncbi:MAG: PAS domain S-box protein [Deltaproteobacteria bacterium]|nr:PAS domain S-box protein [Deltaproteobacteria bacterium]